MCKLLDFLRAKFSAPRPAPLPSVGPRTIDDPMSFMIGAGAEGRRLTVHDLLTERRHDWPLPQGWLVSDSVLLDDGGALQTFSHRPWGPFTLANGDGGQIARLGADGFVRLTETRDGGTPYQQYFVGQNNGGTGWIAFGVDAPTGSWRELVATLAKSNWSDARPPLGRAFTRYRLELLAMPCAHEGVETRRALFTIISEHYDGETIAASQVLERSYFAQDVGLVRWEAWGRTAEAPVPDLASRYHPVDFSVPPAEGWHLDDIRTWTNVWACAPTSVPVMS